MLPGFIFGGAAIAFTALLVATYYHARAISKSRTNEEREYHVLVHRRGGLSLFGFAISITIVLPLFLERFLVRYMRNTTALPWLDGLHAVSVIVFLAITAILCFWLTGKTWSQHPLLGRVCLLTGLILEIEGAALYVHYFR